MDWLERWHIPRWAGSLFVMILILALLVSVLFWLVPLVSAELGQMVGSLPTLSTSLKTLEMELAVFFHGPLGQVFADSLSALEGRPGI